jgi:hypothetical protein
VAAEAAAGEPATSSRGPPRDILPQSPEAVRIGGVRVQMLVDGLSAPELPSTEGPVSSTKIRDMSEKGLLLYTRLQETTTLLFSGLRKLQIFQLHGHRHHLQTKLSPSSPNRQKVLGYLFTRTRSAHNRTRKVTVKRPYALPKI